MSTISKLIPLFKVIDDNFPLEHPDFGKGKSVLNTANDKIAHPEAVLHPASPLITADKELNPLVNGAVPDYKSTAIALAAQLLDKHDASISNLNTIGDLRKAHSDQLKNVMVLAGVIRSLRPVVKAIRDTPFLWAFVPKSLKDGVDLVLRTMLPVVDDTPFGGVTPTDSKFRPL